jgi:inner membrane protein
MIIQKGKFMPTILSHMAVPLAGRLAFGKTMITPGLMLLGLVASILPDADVILLRLGVPYDSPLGHRGATHSFAFAFFVAVLLFSLWICLNRPNRQSSIRGFLYLLVCSLSHPLLDLCTNAGHGASLFWPFSTERYFASFRPIETSPLSLRRFFGEAGIDVLVSELFWVWLPAITFGFICFLLQRRKNAR